jgi:hypothetical protein
VVNLSCDYSPYFLVVFLTAREVVLSYCPLLSPDMTVIQFAMQSYICVQFCKSYLGSSQFDFQLIVSLAFRSDEAHLDLFDIGECSVC